jgi:hypothetical protein
VINREVEADIFAQLGKGPLSSRNQLVGATPGMFAKLSGDKLKAFIHVRKYSTSVAHGKWPNKGKVGALEGTLISLAFSLRSAVCVLKAAAPAPTETMAAVVPPLVVSAF